MAILDFPCLLSHKSFLTFIEFLASGHVYIQKTRLTFLQWLIVTSYFYNSYKSTRLNLFVVPRVSAISRQMYFTRRNRNIVYFTFSKPFIGWRIPWAIVFAYIPIDFEFIQSIFVLSLLIAIDDVKQRGLRSCHTVVSWPQAKHIHISFSSYSQIFFLSFKS